MEIDFKKITIIGVGLIGGSIAKTLKKKNKNIEIVGVGRNQETLEKAKSLGVIDSFSTSPEEGVYNSDLIIIATPVKIIPGIIEKINDCVKKNCIITDAGSSKSYIVDEVNKIQDKNFYFVGSHPMAGSEKKGVDFATSDLYEGSVCFVTKTKRINTYALNKVNKFWQYLGAKTIIISPDDHDSIVASTSHVPHILATLLVYMIKEEMSNCIQIKEGIAKGFKDTTRIASGDPVMWRDICISNKKHILKKLNDLRLNLFKMETLIQMEDSEGLYKFFLESKNFRDNI